MSKGSYGRVYSWRKKIPDHVYHHAHVRLCPLLFCTTSDRKLSGAWQEGCRPANKSPFVKPELDCEKWEPFQNTHEEQRFQIIHVRSSFQMLGTRLHRQANRHADRQTDRQTDGRTDGQTHTHTHTHTHTRTQKRTHTCKYACARTHTHKQCSPTRINISTLRKICCSCLCTDGPLE